MKDVDYEWLARAIAPAHEGGPEEQRVALGRGVSAASKVTTCALP